MVAFNLIPVELIHINIKNTHVYVSGEKIDKHIEICTIRGEIIINKIKKRIGKKEMMMMTRTRTKIMWQEE